MYCYKYKDIPEGLRDVGMVPAFRVLPIIKELDRVHAEYATCKADCSPADSMLEVVRVMDALDVAKEYIKGKRGPATVGTAKDVLAEIDKILHP